MGISEIPALPGNVHSSLKHPEESIIALRQIAMSSGYHVPALDFPKYNIIQNYTDC